MPRAVKCKLSSPELRFDNTPHTELIRVSLRTKEFINITVLELHTGLRSTARRDIEMVQFGNFPHPNTGPTLFTQYMKLIRVSIRNQ